MVIKSFRQIKIEDIRLAPPKANKKKNTGTLIRPVDADGGQLAFQAPILPLAFNADIKDGIAGPNSTLALKLQGDDKDAQEFKAFLTALSDHIAALIEQNVETWCGPGTKALLKLPKSLVNDDKPEYAPTFRGTLKLNEAKDAIDVPVLDLEGKELDPEVLTIGRRVVAIFCLPFIHFNKTPLFSFKAHTERVMVIDSTGKQEFTFNLEDPSIKQAVEEARRSSKREREEAVVEDSTSKAPRTEDDNSDDDV